MSVSKEEKILEAATVAFTQYGFRGTTIENIAKIAKVGKGTVYTFFSSKEELFQVIMQRSLTKMLEAARHARPKGVSLQESIPPMLTAILEFRKSHLFFIKMIQEARDLQTAQVLESVDTMDTVIIDTVEGLIKEEIKKGASFQQEPRVIAFIVYRIYLMLIHEWERKHEPLDQQVITSIIQRQIW